MGTGDKAAEFWNENRKPSGNNRRKFIL